MPNPDSVKLATTAVARAHAYGGDPKKIAEAKANLAYAKAEKAIQKALEFAAPLPDEKKRELAALFRGGAGNG